MPDRYIIVAPFEDPKVSGYVAFDTLERRQVAVIWRDGPGGIPAARVAVRLARWLNRLAEVDAESQQLRREEEER